MGTESLFVCLLDGPEAIEWKELIRLMENGIAFVEDVSCMGRVSGLTDRQKQCGR